MRMVWFDLVWDAYGLVWFVLVWYAYGMRLVWFGLDWFGVVCVCVMSIYLTSLLL